MTERADAQFPQVPVRKIGQNGEIDVVRGERGGVLPEPEPLEPIAYFRRRAARFMGPLAISLFCFQSSGLPLGTRGLDLIPQNAPSPIVAEPSEAGSAETPSAVTSA